MPQQLHSPPAPLMGSQQMPMHPGHANSGYSGNGDQLMQGQNDDVFYNQDPANDMMMDPQALEEERMRAEENIYNTHLDAVKEEVQV